MSYSYIDAKVVSVVGGAECVVGPTLKVPLDDYPLLVFAPLQWGADVCTEDGKITVARAVKEKERGMTIGQIALKFGTTEEHVKQAIGYAYTSGYIIAK